MADPVAQAIGLAATLAYVIATLQHDDKKLFGTQLSGAMLFVVHYAMLSAWAGVFGYLVGTSRNITAFMGWATPRRRTMITVIFAFAYGLVAILTFRQWADVIPPISGWLTALAFFNFTGVRMRIVLLSAQALFILYAICVGSIGGVLTPLNEMIFTCLTISRLLRAATVPQGK